MGALCLVLAVSLFKWSVSDEDKGGEPLQAGLLATKEAQPVHLCTITAGHIAVALGGAASFADDANPGRPPLSLCGLGRARANEPTRRTPPSLHAPHRAS
jgi:hypothetical protein